MGAISSASLPFVNRFAFHYWLVIFAILARLVLGELAHAMPQPPEPTTQECANHTPANATDESDCCKSTQCECACIHATEFVGARVKADFGRSHLPSLNRFLANASVRPNELFRPPA
jgi:hypothetical protein